MLTRLAERTGSDRGQFQLTGQLIEPQLNRFSTFLNHQQYHDRKSQDPLASEIALFGSMGLFELVTFDDGSTFGQNNFFFHDLILASFIPLSNFLTSFGLT